ncbi:craniofacial development protein 2-like [Centruroides vittatus]|uniref:craniofacial development protein 2-like n=1 Tax=Centruroides vittatus TaxID=120091 RepID=UPI00350F8D81
MRTLEGGEKVIVGGDFNGYIGKQNMGYERVHGGHGVGELNQEGKSILGFAVAFDLVIVNSFFTKQERHLITLNSRPHSSQIDYILTRQEHLAIVINCKVIPTDQISAQHRLMCIDMKSRMHRKIGNTQMKKIKWFRLREERMRVDYVERVLLQISQDWEGVQD